MIITYRTTLLVCNTGLIVRSIFVLAATVEIIALDPDVEVELGVGIGGCIGMD